MKALLPSGVAGAISRRAALPASAPEAPDEKRPLKKDKEKAEQPPREAPAKQLFDAAWYVTRYPDAPTDPDEAFRNHLEAGMRKGRFPNPFFENFRRPARAHIPQEHLYRVTSSPILCRVPPTRYLTPYQTKTRLHKLYNTFDEYLRRAMINPDTIGPELWESDLRVVAYMDNSKRKFAADASTAPQDALVSVIMATRNRASIVADAILSVLMQSYENWELIVVDDASDGHETEAIVRQFGDSRIRYVRLAEQAGIGGARNAGIERSTGRLIAYLDDDDQWDPDCLLILWSQMRLQGARLAYGALAMWDRFDPDARLGAAFKGIRFAPFNRGLLENTNYISPTTLIHERDLLNEAGRFDASLKRHVGWDFALRLTEVAAPAAIPCLLGHSFQGKADDGIPTIPDGDSDLDEIRSRLALRADWAQPFTTSDGKSHMAVSTAGKARERRREKLSGLPVEPVQIVIPNYESASELEMCLRSIAEHTTTPYHIVIVDNGSSDETYAELEKLPRAFDNVRLIRENSHSGFSYAVNRGLAEVIDRDEKILILNNDTLATPDWLDELRYVMLKHEDAGMAVPRQVLPANSRIFRVHVPGATGALECDINLSIHHSNILDPDFDRDDGLIELTYAPLFCGLVRPEVIKAANGLDSANAPHYRSDWILCDFMRRHLRQRIVYTPHSKVYHLQGVATDKRRVSEGFLDQPSARSVAPSVPDSMGQTQAKSQ